VTETRVRSLMESSSFPACACFASARRHAPCRGRRRSAPVPPPDVSRRGIELGSTNGGSVRGTEDSGRPPGLSPLDLGPLHFPGGEAPDVQVVPIQARGRAIAEELQLVLRLVAPHGLPAQRARRPDTSTTPRAIGVTSGEPSRANDSPRERTEFPLIGHLDCALHSLPTAGSVVLWECRSGARCHGIVRQLSTGTLWKAPSGYCSRVRLSKRKYRTPLAAAAI
jgi:hypothetical protein